MTTETTLEHAEHLPGATFRVFPSAYNHRNSYDTERGVKGAVAQRRRWYGPFNGTPVKVYRAVTVWEDVTADYVKS